MAQENHPRSPPKERITSCIKESRQFMKILQSVVFLFYVSWLSAGCLSFYGYHFRHVLSQFSVQSLTENQTDNSFSNKNQSRPFERL